MPNISNIPVPMVLFIFLTFLILLFSSLIGFTGFFINFHREVYPSSFRPPVSRLPVSLTFDLEDIVDDNESKAIPLLLQVLENHGAKATFFIVGRFADKNPELIRKIHSASHEIGLHTQEHHFPIFDEDQAAAVALVYKTSPEYVWERSYKSPVAFQESLEANRKAIRRVLGNVDISAFRSPCLVPNWGSSSGSEAEYFRVLKQSGIMFDSSVIQDFTSPMSPPRQVFARDSVIEIPITRGDDILESEPWDMISKVYEAGVPVVFMFHPGRLDEHDVDKLDTLLTEIESRYGATYLKIGDIAVLFSNA